MTATLENVLMVLRKWESESVPISGQLVCDGASILFGGLIKQLCTDALVITQYAKPNEKVGGVTLDLGKVTGFEYGDARELPQESRKERAGRIDQIIVLHFANATCVLYGGEPT